LLRESYKNKNKNKNASDECPLQWFHFVFYGKRRISKSKYYLGLCIRTTKEKTEEEKSKGKQ
jgi:hypothetical protein